MLQSWEYKDTYHVFPCLKHWSKCRHKAYKGIMIVVQQQWHWYRECAILSILYTSPKWQAKQGVVARSMTALDSKNLDHTRGVSSPKSDDYWDQFMNFWGDGFIWRPRYMDVYQRWPTTNITLWTYRMNSHREWATWTYTCQLRVSSHQLETWALHLSKVGRFENYVKARL